MIKDRAARISQAKALLDAGHTAAAERIYSDLTTTDPEHFAGFVGLARSAVRRHDWDQAADRWTAVLTRFPERAQRPWRLGHAKALVAAGRAAEARGTIEALLAANIADSVALFLLTRMVMAGPRAEAHLALGHPALSEAGVFAAHLARLRLLLWLNDMPAARAAYQAATALAREASDWDVLFESIAKLFPEAERAEAWRAVGEAVGALAGRPAASEEEGAQTALLLRVRLALRDHSGFLALLDTASNLPSWFAAMASRLAEALRDPGYPNAQAPKLFGIGLSKTGTTSLTTALEMLGYSAAHFQNPFTETVISQDDCYLFDALIDEPVAVDFERLYETFPNARFIYTRRDFPAWLESFEKHYASKHGSADFAELRRLRDSGKAFGVGGELAAVSTALYLNHPDAEAAYRAHEDRVAAFFADKPKQKLLVHDVFAGQGWAELCAFLDVPEPDLPYPWDNRAT